MAYPILKDSTDACMKCGFCMSNCPVYNIDKLEAHVARGRNMLIQLAENKKIVPDNYYKSILYYCLLCGRCEAMCPAKVLSNTITLKARKELIKQTGLSLMQRLVYRGLIKHRSFFARLGALATLVPGLTAKENQPIRHFPDIVSAALTGVSFPRLSVPFLTKRVKKKAKSESVWQAAKIAFFSGCLTEFFFASTGTDMISILQQAGYNVDLPEQTCCGLAVYSAGDFDTAVVMAKRNIDSLSGYDYIVTGCASCSSTLKGYVNWFDEGEYKQKAVELSKKVKDFAQFIVQQDIKPKGVSGKPLKVTYHDPCHLRWKQGILAEPRAVLKNIDGVEFVEMEGADSCCGLGGSFGITHPDVSKAIQAKKVEAIKKSGADVVVTSCPGCMIQLMDGLRRYKLPVKVMHIAELMKK
ncbi:MAG: (Fe-S)-binding protein [Spirochaetota bacterium]